MTLYELLKKTAKILTKKHWEKLFDYFIQPRKTPTSKVAGHS